MHGESSAQYNRYFNCFFAHFLAFEFTSHRFYSAQVDRHFVTDVTEHRYFLGDKCDQSTSTNSDYLVQWERFGKAYWHPVKAVQFGFE